MQTNTSLFNVSCHHSHTFQDFLRRSPEQTSLSQTCLTMKFMFWASEKKMCLVAGNTIQLFKALIQLVRCLIPSQP